MKFTANVTDLIHCVAICAATCDKRDPKLSHVRIEALKNSVNFCSCSLSSGTLANSPAKVSEMGVAGVDCNALLKVLRQCEDDVELLIKSNNLAIRCGEQRYNLLLVDNPDSLPFKPQNSFGDYVLPLAEVKSIINLCTPAASVIHANEYKGITIEVSGEKVRFSALHKNAAAGASGYVVGGKVKGDGKPLLVSMDLCAAIMAMPNKDDKGKLEIGVNGNVVAYRHQYGYSYFALLAGKPIEAEILFGKFAKALKENESKSVLVPAGIFATCIKRVLVMADKDEGNKGKLTGQGKGKLVVYCHTQDAGAAQNTIITAGDFSGKSWYNLRYLLDYTGRIHADDEIRLTPVGNPGSEHLVISHGKSLYILTSCGAPDDHNDDEPEAKPKAKRK